MNAIIESAPQEIVVQQTPASIMAMAVQQGASIESLERMWALQVRYEERQAEKSFVSAMAEFKMNPPKILKEKHVKFGTTEYFHATHSSVTGAIIEGLAQHGITHRWDMDQKDGKIGVTCVLTHRDGHSQTTRLESAHDTSGGKNSIQAIMSSKTYLERHTLLAATGLSTSDIEDDDGAGAGQAVEVPAELLQAARDAAMGGWKALAAWIKGRTDAEVKALEPESDNLKAAAKAVDKAKVPA